VAAPTIRQGAMGRSFTRGYGCAEPAADAGDGATLVQVGPAAADALVAAPGTVAILVVIGAGGATDSPGGGIIAPRGRGSSGSMSSSSARGLSDLRKSSRACEAMLQLQVDGLFDGGAPSDTLGG
jgi:hypothetical protein